MSGNQTFTVGRKAMDSRTSGGAAANPYATVAAPPSQTDIMRRAILDLERPDEYVTQIGRLWKDAQHSFLAIGQYLVQAKEKLPGGEFEAMVEASLPFGKQTAYQFRCVAEAIDDGRLRLEEMPRSSSLAYQLAALKPEEFVSAKKHDLVRPDVTRAEMVHWKREVLFRTRIATGSNYIATSRLRGNIVKRIRRLEEELEKARRELASMDSVTPQTQHIIEGNAEETSR